jgi:hypothetical protein
MGILKLTSLHRDNAVYTLFHRHFVEVTLHFELKMYVCTGRCLIKIRVIAIVCRNIRAEFG